MRLCNYLVSYGLNILYYIESMTVASQNLCINSISRAPIDYKEAHRSEPINFIRHACSGLAEKNYF